MDSSTSEFKITLAQIEVVPGRPHLNVDTMLRFIKEHAGTSDLIAFPEMAVSGYLLGDLWYNKDWCEWMMSFNAQLEAASAEFEIALLYGNIYLPNDGSVNKDGRQRKFNAAYLVQNGIPAPREKQFLLKRIPDGIQPKTLLPNYRFFDDVRYFFSYSDEVFDEGLKLPDAYQPFLLKTKAGEPIRVGLQVCEDLWCEDYRFEGRALNIARFYQLNGADLILNISASPWTYGKNKARHKRIAFLQQDEAHIPFLYVNRVGAENCGDNVIVFEGGSTIYRRNGSILSLASADYKEGTLECVFRKNGEHWELEADSPNGDYVEVIQPASAEEKIAKKCDAIVRGLQHLELMTGLHDRNSELDPASRKALQFVIGLSGGMDSAVVAALLVLAFGKENVVALTMPSQHTSEATLKNAHAVATALGIKLFTAPIEPIVNTMQQSLDVLVSSFSPSIVHTEVAHENEQARIRGSVFLSGMAGRLGRLYTSNSNKLETALGYATLYGDVNGAMAPIADLTKIEVVDLARYLNAKVFQKEVIPRNLLPSDSLWHFPNDGVQPSAELAARQIDPMRFGYHDALLDTMAGFHKISAATILRWYLEGSLHTHLNIPLELLKRWNLEDPRIFIEDLEWFTNRLRQNIFKRIQAPPIVVTSKNAFGYDMRESLGAVVWTDHYKELRAKVLQLPAYPGAD